MRFNSFVKQAQLIEARLKSVGSQTKVITTAESVSASQQNKLKLFSSLANQKYNEFEKLSNKLFATVPLPEDLDDKVIMTLQESISDLYISIQSEVNALIVPVSVNQTEADLNSSQTQPSTSTPSINLPRLNLPTFNGQADCWIQFHSLFENAVHKNESISNIEKFSYLLSSLVGEPLSLIKSLPLTQANYHIAWQALIKRYHNSRLLISLHVNNLLDLQPVTNLSAKHMRIFLSRYNENSQALQALGHDLSNDSLILTTHLMRKVCHEIRDKFEHSRNSSADFPKLDEFITFLENECSRMEAASLTGESQASWSSDKFSIKKHNASLLHPCKPNKVNVSMLTSSQRATCSYCSSSSHIIYKCDNFKLLTAQCRLTYIKEKHLCQNCFGSHKLADCRSKRNCNVCNKRHHTMLHFTPTTHTTAGRQDNNLPPLNQTEIGTQQNASSSVTPNFAGISCNQNTTVLLSTALVKISTHCNNSTIVRAVLDSASQTSFISERVANLLQVQRFNTHKASLIHGISSSQVKTKGISHVTLSALNGQSLASSHPVMILDKIAGNLPKVTISPEIKQKLMGYGLTLADPTFDTPAPVELLIGADLFALCLRGPPLSLGPSMPSALHTIFGHVIIGVTPITQPHMSDTLATLLTINDVGINDSIQRFWSLEEPPLASKLTPENQQCEDHFLATHSRTENGRYVCCLPFLEDPSTLGNSSNTALKSLYAVEGKFKRQPELKPAYVDFMNDYLKNGHMERCQPPSKNELHCYLPHHAVFKDDKIRVVFNASAFTSNNTSLNSILHQGPKLHNDIIDIIFKFRFDRFVFTCDIRQMFRQIEIAEADKRFQLIFWRDETNKPIETYKLNTVTFGLASSPFIANRVVQQLIHDEGYHHPLAAEALRHQVYVDDILLGSSSELLALQLQQEVIQLLKRGGFELRKWTANSQLLLDSVPADHQDQPLYFRSQDEPTFSVLGLMWSPKSDSFFYKVDPHEQPPTKRSVLSLIAKIFDPCGWITPIVLWAKALMQHIWTLGLQWSDALPNSLAKKWMNFLNDLQTLNTLQIPRFLGISTEARVQVHGFSDASEIAYGACVYIRLEESSSSVTTHLLIGKSRVAPLKRTSLPRLELCGAHMLAKLLHYCTTQISSTFQITSVHAWCDSIVALSWIHTPSYRLKTFVGNRVAEIQEVTPPAIWKHVPSSQNPADCASRGTLPSELTTHSLWWKGPQWLNDPSDAWPHSTFKIMEAELLQDIRPSIVENLVTTETKQFDLLCRYSSWERLTRITAYVLRFIHRLKAKVKSVATLTPNEIQTASNLLCKLIQQKEFSEEIALLKKGKPCTSRIRRLAPFLDHENIIRVGGRLRNAPLDYTAKHPILLPKKHYAVDLLIDYYHLRLLHAGPVVLQATITQNFWILSARSIIRSRIFKCVRCFKTRPKVTAPFMGDLPLERVTPTKPFTSTGMDFAGPFTIKLYSLRRLQAVKVYLCLFICFATKAIHLEVVNDLTSDAFIAALTRFMARRGMVSDLHSDCGTNFVGAATALRKCFQDLLKTPDLQQYALRNKIVFHFLPPHAPHQGGLWERAVKSAKYHFRRVIGTHTLTYEEFVTLTARIEAVLNSRPLTPLSSDPNDLNALTPGHFLTGGPILTPAEPKLTDYPTNRLKRWQIVQAFTQHIWRRWQKEYLYTLQQRSKWDKMQENLKVNSLVIVHDWNTPPLQWKLARITSVIPGPDGVVRVVHLKTASGNISRPAVKVSLLPIYQD